MTVLFGDVSITYIVCSILAYIPAIVLHELAHGFAAYKLGDPTAKRAGRLTLNPLSHVDPFGTVLLPLMLMLMNMPIFGYAKPVPYNPRFFKNPQRDDLIVGLAGPAANCALALLGSALAWGLYGFATSSATLGTMGLIAIAYNFARMLVSTFLPYFVLINLFLMFFNLLPIPPLDGSSIFAAFCPRKYLPQYYKIQQYAMPIFLLVAVLLPELLHVNPFGAYLNATAYNLFRFLYP